MANPVVGTVTCLCRDCIETASVHETKRGGANRKSKLYLNCPECRCLQPTSASSQGYIRQNMVPREGFEYLTEVKPNKPLNEPKSEPEIIEEKKFEGQVNIGFLALFGMAALAALAVIS